jgi:L-Ala-D/L-Glu epimerase
MKELSYPPELKISGVEAIPFRIPYRRVHWQAIGALDAMENILIRIRTESGLIGIGEALSTNKFNSNTLWGTTWVIRNCLVPAIIGENVFNVARIWERMNRARSGEVFAKSGIDIALHDLIGKALGQPVSSLIGGRVANEVQIEGPGYGIGIMSPEEMADVAARAVDNGLTQIEIKISGSLREDVERLKRIREAIGPDPSIKIDMTEGYSVKGAISAIRALEEYGVDWIEQPIHHSLLQGLREIRQSVSTPIIVDESATSVEDLLAVISNSAADGVHIKLPVVGGFTVARKMLALAEAAHLYVLPGSDTATGVGLAAVTHFAASSFFHRGIHGSPLARAVDDIVHNPTPESATALRVPIAPGLGVEIDEDKLARYAVTC